MTANFPDDAGVRLDRVTFSYAAGAAMAFDCLARAGAITAVMGPSGSGKSTLLNLVAGFEAPASGRILIGGRDVTALAPAERPVSMVFQENNLFAHLTVEDNVGLGISPALKLSADDRASVARSLAHTGLAGKEKRLPRELSGGERPPLAVPRDHVPNPPLRLSRAHGHAPARGRPAYRRRRAFPRERAGRRPWRGGGFLRRHWSGGVPALYGRVAR